jgi:uncharacterized damage-inducible protein DinB
MNPLPDFEEEMKSTRKVLERVPTEKFGFTPHAKSKPMIWLAGHVATLPGWATTALTTESLKLDDFTPPPPPKNTEELVAEFDKNVAAAREQLAKVTPEQLQAQWSCSYKGQEFMKSPRAVVLRNVVMNHLIHHRAQLTMYLRMAEIPVPGLYGPSADESSMFDDASSSAAGS